MVTRATRASQTHARPLSCSPSTNANGPTKAAAHAKRPPMLVEALRAMIDTCETTKPRGFRDRALLLVGFNAMCRRSELSGLNIGDVRDAGDDGVTMYIRRSKTDQSARGAEVSVPYGQHTETCAVRAARAWVGELAARGISDGPLFRPIDRYGTIAGQAKQAGTPAIRLTGKSVSDMVHRRALLARLPDPAGYTGHSLRSGAAKSAYLAGAPVAEIALHGRWAANSPSCSATSAPSTSGGTTRA